MAIPSASGAAGPEATTVVAHTIYGSRLGQTEINRLAQAVADGIAPWVSFDTNWHGTRLRGTSLQQLRRAIDRCFQPGDSRQLDTLELSSVGHGRQVQVAIGEQAAIVTVEAEEAAWAIGKAQQIRDILLHARGCSRLRRWREMHLSLLGTIISLAGIVAAFRIGLLTVDFRSIVLAATSVAGTVATGYLVGSWRAAGNRTVIWVAGALPRRGWAGWSSTDRIAAVSVVVGFLGVLATLVT